MTLRSAKAGSMESCSIADLTSFTQVRSFGASPRMAVAEVRRKLETETPGTSTGYCIARKTPAARTLVDGHLQDVLAVEGHGATGDGVLRVTGERVRQGGLAGAVRTHDGVRLTLLDGEVDALEDLAGAVLGLDGDVQVVDFKRCHGYLRTPG